MAASTSWRQGERIAAQALLATGHAPAQTAVSAPKAVAAAQAPKDLTPYQGLFRDPVSGDLVRWPRGRRATDPGARRFAADSGCRWARTASRSPTVASSPSSARASSAASIQHDERRRHRTFVAVRPAATDAVARADYIGTYYGAPSSTPRSPWPSKATAWSCATAFGGRVATGVSFADAFTTRLRERLPPPSSSPATPMAMSTRTLAPWAGRGEKTSISSGDKNVRVTTLLRRIKRAYKKRLAAPVVKAFALAPRGAFRRQQASLRSALSRRNCPTAPAEAMSELQFGDDLEWTLGLTLIVWRRRALSRTSAETLLAVGASSRRRGP